MNNKKDILRKKLLEARLKMNEDEIEFLSKRVCFRIVNSFYMHQRIIGLYFPIKNEVNVLHLTKYHFDNLCLPFINGHDMVFKSWKVGDIMSISEKFNVPEPFPESHIMEPEVLLVPIVGFDPSCNRIGYGAGFYDRYLKNFKGLTIGVSFECLKVPQIDVDNNDIKLDFIVTEDKIYEGRIVIHL